MSRRRPKPGETIGDMVDQIERGEKAPPPPGWWLPFGFRAISRKHFRQEMSGAADLFLEMGRVLGRAEVAQHYGIELPPGDMTLSSGLRLYPPTE